ncbi:MAG: signal peptidase I [bacterium]
MNRPRFDQKKFTAHDFKAKESLLNILKPQKIEEPPKPKKRPWLLDTLKVFIAAFITALVIRMFLFQVFYISTNSMEPALSAGDGIIVNKLIYGITNPFWGANDKEKLLFVLPNPLHKKRMYIAKARYIARFSHSPKRMDVIVFRAPANAGELAKRVIALPGEEIKIRKGVIYANGRPLKGKYAVLKNKSGFGPVKVPADSYFVLGDNRSDTGDSRHLGAVSRDNIIGVLAARIWPLGKIRTFK